MSPVERPLSVALGILAQRLATSILFALLGFVLFVIYLGTDRVHAALSDMARWPEMTYFSLLLFLCILICNMLLIISRRRHG